MSKNGSYNDVLIWNGLNFHWEVQGALLEYFYENNIYVTLCNIRPNNGHEREDEIYDDWHKLYARFGQHDTLEFDPGVLLDNVKYFKQVFLPTDDDYSFPDKYIDPTTTLCIDHYYKNRRPCIKKHFPISPWLHKDHWIIPSWKYISYEEKIDRLAKQERPKITFLGRASFPERLEQIARISNFKDFDVQIITQTFEYCELIPDMFDYWNEPNIKVYPNVLSTEMFELLADSTYIIYLPNDAWWNKNALKALDGHGSTGALAMSYTTGCRLACIEPITRGLDKRTFKSPVSWENLNDINSLDTEINVKQIFKERDAIINQRNKVLNEYII